MNRFVPIVNRRWMTMVRQHPWRRRKRRLAPLRLSAAWWSGDGAVAPG
ncbi:Hypothetical protein CAP_6104 [Chondromyces apiculatus DSM 436]|uniref:Uncharacterized protein n=1 Tax=Chondromyces apiculatus DSM 436 TaxID=1192034 RepID=A0A017T1P0_9BACT|nr:Hypothetical protein CAP_6104 [Chondromyces apiculatus DSM 436]